MTKEKKKQMKQYMLIKKNEIRNNKNVIQSHSKRKRN